MVTQPTQRALSAGLQQPDRRREPVGTRRSRRIWLGLIGLIVAVSALGVWATRRASPNPDVLWEQAEQDFQAGHYERAEKSLALLGRLRKPTSLDWMLRAQVAMLRNRLDEALIDLAQVPDHHYMGPQARLLTGQLELRRDRLRFAETAFRAALRLAPTLVQAHRELIFIYGTQLRRAELTAEFLALSRLTDLAFEEAFHWCLLRNESWEPAEVAAMLAKYVAADPNDRGSRLALSENKRRLVLLDEAESVLAGLPEDDPEVIAAQARIAIDRHDVDRAERLLSSGPSEAPVLARLRGRMALGRRDARVAQHHFRIAYAADPDSRETLFGLIGALLMLGDDQAAAPLREIAANREKLGSLTQLAGAKGARDDPELPRRLGAACAALHRDAEARAWYKLAIARDPLDTEAQRALFRLNAGVQGGRQPPGGTR